MEEINNSNIQEPIEEISFKEMVLKIKDWWTYLCSKWGIILFAGLIGGSIGFTIAFLKKPIYTATLSFALEDDKSGGGGFSGAMGLANSLGIDFGGNAGGAFSGANLIELMKSRTLIEKALMNPINVNDSLTSLAEYFIDFSKFRESLNNKTDLAKIHYLATDKRSDFSLQKDSILGEIYNNITGETAILNVSQKDKKVSIITIEVKTENEFFSKALCENIVKEVSEFYIDTKSKKARINVTILQKQADSVRNELNAAISGVAQANDNVFNLNSAFNIKRTPTTHRQVDVQANSAILNQLVTNLEMAKVALLKETPLIQIIDKPILPLKKEKLGKIKIFIVGWMLSSLGIIGILIMRRLFFIMII